MEKIHLSIFFEILYLGLPLNAPAHYRNPIFMYNVALKGPCMRFEVEHMSYTVGLVI